MSRSPLGGGKHQCWNWTKWTLDWLMRIGDGSEFYFLYQEQKKQWQHSGGFIGGKSFLVAFHNWSCCQIFQTSRYQICALAVSCKWPGVHDQTMSKKLFLFVEGSLSFCRGSTRQNFVQFYQTSKKPRQKKKPSEFANFFVCVFVEDRTLRKSMDMRSGIIFVSKGHQTEEYSYQAWTEAERENFARFSYQNFGYAKRVRQFD